MYGAKTYQAVSVHYTERFTAKKPKKIFVRTMHIFANPVTYTDLSLLDILHQAHVQIELASFRPNTISVNCNHKTEYIFAAFV